MRHSAHHANLVTYVHEVGGGAAGSTSQTMLNALVVTVPRLRGTPGGVTDRRFVRWDGWLGRGPRGQRRMP